MGHKRNGGEPPGRPGLSGRHLKTLAAVFARPTRSDIPWRDIEALFRALGGRAVPG